MGGNPPTPQLLGISIAHVQIASGDRDAAAAPWPRAAMC